MEKDKLIAIVLVGAFLFLSAALIGVVAITGFVLVFTSPSTVESTGGPTTSIIDNVDINTNLSESSTEEPETVEEEEPQEPVCGNNKKESGEQCETDSQCSANQICNDSCSCEDKPAEKILLEDITVTGLRFWCAPDFEGQKGLAINKIDIKNSGATDFSTNGTVTITAVTGNTTDSVKTKSSFKFEIKAGKTLSIYNSNLARTSAPYIFLGSTPDTTKITIDVGNNQYIEYSYTLKGNDFGLAGCL